MFYAFVLYALILLLIVFLSYKRHTSEADFVLGNRSINFWVTAISAHASDMSSWLLMGFPSVIFLKGLKEAWIAVGLVLFMFLNWHLIAPKLRIATEKYQSLTLSSFLESRFHDETGFLRIITGLICLLFFIFYISAGLVGLGFVFELAFNIPYAYGVCLGIFIAILYTVIGGFISVAWTDLFQGLFLLIMIILVPVIACISIGGFEPIADIASKKQIDLSFFPKDHFLSWLQIIFLILGWGPGYFGQPHILTKFMGIKNPSEMYKAKYLGISWQILAMLAAVFVGIVAIGFYPEGLNNPELLFIIMTKKLFFPFLSGFILCAILAATISTMESQILVVATLLSEDFYKRLIRPHASSRELLWISRSFVIIVALLAFVIAYLKIASIYSLVLYSWSGLGASFGPAIIFALYSKKATRQGIIAGILIGAAVSACWPYFNKLWTFQIPELIPAFLLSSLAIWILSYESRFRHAFPRKLPQ